MKLLSFIVFCLLIGLPCGAYSDDSTQYSSVKSVVNEYCQSDFNGIRDIRMNLAKYSRKGKIEEEKRNPGMVAGVFSWEVDSLYIVSAFKIIDIRIDKKQAVASVEYVRLAHTEGSGYLERKIIPDFNEHDVLLLNLIYEKGKWKILDPPQPMISKEALLNFYKNEKEEYEKYVINNPKAKPSELQKQGYEKVKENLEIVEKLGKK